MTDQATRVVFDDPHLAAPVEAETMRVRTLNGVWRWALIVLRFFVGFTPLNTEYFYLLILCMLPFTFLIFPGSQKASVDRIAWYDLVLFVGTAASAF